MKSSSIFLWLAIAAASIISTPFVYAYFIPARTWCHVPFTSRFGEIVREGTVLVIVLAMCFMFIWGTIHSLKRIGNVYANMAIFLLSFAMLVNVFAIYFYTFGLIAKLDGQIFLSGETIVMNMGEYIYFAMANSIFTTVADYEPCPSLWGGVTLQRISSLFVALGGSLLSARLTKHIED